MKPTIELGPLTFQSFGILFALGFVAGGALVARRLGELGRPPRWAYEMVLAALVGGLVGSRLDYLLQNLDRVRDDLAGSLFSGTGLAWFGGMLGGAVAVLIWARVRGFLSLSMLDLCAPALALGYAVGRVGSQLAGDGDYGVASGLPWAMAYPEGTVPTLEEVHPTPIYESVAMGLVALVLWHLRDRFRPGTLFALYLVLAGAERLLVEVLRRNEPVMAGLTVAQLIGIALIVAGGAWLARPGALAPGRA